MMKEINSIQCQKIAGGWNPFAAALNGAQKSFNTGSQILGPLGGTVTGLLGLLGGFIAGLFSA